MNTKLLILISCLTFTTAAFSCGDCGGDSSSSNCGGDCSCVDPACGAPYSCMGYGECCAAFGNIGAFDSTPAQDDTEYSYSTTNLLFTDNTSYATARPYGRSYKGE